MTANIRKLLGFEIERPDPEGDLEELMKCLQDPKCFERMVRDAVVVGRWRSFIENDLPRVFQVATVDPPPEGCTDVALDACDTRLVHASQLSEVEVELLTGRAEVTADGNGPVEIAGSIRVQGWVEVHGLQDGTQIRYCEVA